MSYLMSFKESATAAGLEQQMSAVSQLIVSGEGFLPNMNCCTPAVLNKMLIFCCFDMKWSVMFRFSPTTLHFPSDNLWKRWMMTQNVTSIFIHAAWEIIIISMLRKPCWCVFAYVELQDWDTTCGLSTELPGSNKGVVWNFTVWANSNYVNRIECPLLLTLARYICFYFSPFSLHLTLILCSSSLNM